MKSFDSILKSGKLAATDNNLDLEWKITIASILVQLQKLNDMYDTPNVPQITVREAECNGCGRITYLVYVKEIDSDKEKAMHQFLLGDWEGIDTETRYCPQCREERRQ